MGATCPKKQTQNIIKQVVEAEIVKSLEKKGISNDSKYDHNYERVKPSIYILPLMKVSIDYTFFVLRRGKTIFGAIIIGEEDINVLIYQDPHSSISDVHIWFSSYVVANSDDSHACSIPLADPTCFDKIDKSIDYVKHVWM